MNKKVVSKHIRMGAEIAEWYEKKSEMVGIPHTNLMVVALMEYMKQSETVDIFGELKKEEKNKGVE